MNIYINVVNQTLHVTSSLEYIVEGSQNFVRFRFGLDDEWSTLTTFAQFAQNGVAYNVYLDEDNCVYLPAEIVCGKCTLMLYGTGSDNVIATSNYLTLTISGNIMVTDAQSTEITPSLYEQLVAMVTQTQADVDVLEARVDLLTSLPAGSTAGDAELMDIRVGADGVTYNTAGGAVRANINKKLDSIQSSGDAGKPLIVDSNGLVSPALLNPVYAHMQSYSSIYPIGDADIADITTTDTLMDAIRKLRGIMRWDMVPKKQTISDYAAGTDTSQIAATDTINGAFAKLQAQSTRLNGLLAAESYTPTWTTGSYINGSGVMSTYSAGRYSNVINLSKGESISVEWSVGSTYGISAISKYDADNASYSVLVNNGYDENNTTFRYTCTEDSIAVVLSSYRQMVVTVNIFRPSPISVEASNILGLNEALPTPWEYALDEVLCIGDSLTVGTPADVGTGTPTMPNPMRQNYPYYLGRMLNTNVTNAGFAGYTTKDWYDLKRNNYNLSAYNAVIIFLGTNGNLTDTLAEDTDYQDYNDYAESYTGYYCRLIEFIQNNNPNCAIVLVNVWSVSNPSSLTDTTRSVIRQIGAKYSLPVIETYDLRYAVSPEYHGGFNNVHMAKSGYLALANRICTTLRAYYNAHKSAINVGMTS